MILDSIEKDIKITEVNKLSKPRDSFNNHFFNCIFVAYPLWFLQFNLDIPLETIVIDESYESQCENHKTYQKTYPVYYLHNRLEVYFFL